jgi:hypothetical protein
VSSVWVYTFENFFLRYGPTKKIKITLNELFWWAYLGDITIVNGTGE